MDFTPKSLHLPSLDIDRARSLPNFPRDAPHTARPTGQKVGELKLPVPPDISRYMKYINNGLRPRPPAIGKEHLQYVRMMRNLDRRTEPDQTNFSNVWSDVDQWLLKFRHERREEASTARGLTRDIRGKIEASLIQSSEARRGVGSEIDDLHSEFRESLLKVRDEWQDQVQSARADEERKHAGVRSIEQAERVNQRKMALHMKHMTERRRNFLFQLAT
jgi:hypothetical protein